MTKSQHVSRNKEKAPTSHKHNSLIVKSKVNVVRLEGDGLLDPRPRGPLVAITRHNETMSPLLRLPPELRNKVYAYVFGGMTFRYGAFVHDKNDDDDDFTPCRWTDDVPINTASNSEESDHKSYRRIGVNLPTGMRNPPHIALTRVCRSIYAETRLLPFATTTFELCERFADRSSDGVGLKLLRPQLYAITTIQVLLAVRRNFKRVVDLRRFRWLKRFPRLRHVRLLHISDHPLCKCPRVALRGKEIRDESKKTPYEKHVLDVVREVVYKSVTVTLIRA